MSLVPDGALTGGLERGVLRLANQARRVFLFAGRGVLSCHSVVAVPVWDCLPCISVIAVVVGTFGGIFLRVV